MITLVLAWVIVGLAYAVALPVALCLFPFRGWQFMDTLNEIVSRMLHMGEKP